MGLGNKQGEKRWRTLTLPCRWKSNTANEQTYPSPSTCTVNSLKKSTIAGAHGGSEYQSTNGVRMTDRSSCANVMTFIANSSPYSPCTFLEWSSPFHSSGM